MLHFLAFLLIQNLYESSAISFQAGKSHVPTIPPGFFACEKVSFPEPFNGGKEIKVFASKSRKVKSPIRGNGAASWVESINRKNFTVCVQEFDHGSNATAEVNWIALQSAPVGSQLGTSSFISWTTGTLCKRIAIQQGFPKPPRILVTARHQILQRPQDAMAAWVEDLRGDSFRICLRETKLFDGIHENIKVDWMVFSNLSLENFTLTDSLVFANSDSQSQQNNNAFCKKINFSEPFFAPPVVIVTPICSYKVKKSLLPGSGCKAITAWVEYTSTKDAEVCVKKYNTIVKKEVIKIDYVVIGDLDPCIEVTCYYHSHCKAFAPQDARCVCAESCPSYKEPVCSSNGTTYENKCLFEQEMCLLRLNFTLQHPGSCEGFPYQRGRRHMPHIPSLGYSHCETIQFKPYVFYPHKPIDMQITVNHVDTNDESYVHDATVSWVEDVTIEQFTACVMAAGYNERKSYANVTVDWIAYQGAPVGGVTGEVRISQWWTGTTCETVKFPAGEFSVKPSVFVTARHLNSGLKRDASCLWIEDVTQKSCKVCLRELQNFAGSHQDIYVNWLVFSNIHKPPFLEHNSINFANNKTPAVEDNNAFCKDVNFANVYNITPHVFVSASHSTKGGNLDPVHNGIAAWVEYINKAGFRVCLKEFYETKYDPLTVVYTVSTDLCPRGWGYFSGKCYLTSSACAPWLTAVLNCSSMDSHLVTVHNQEENVYIQHRHNGQRSWIGLNDRSVEGSFVWANKETSGFRFWAPDQPNNLKNQDCVHTLGAKHGYTWNDVPCDKCYYYTCSKDIDKCTTNFHSCDVNAICQNTVGSYSCICKAGYIGDGKKCNATRGWYSHDPAFSCKDIRDLGSSKGDGEYWIDLGQKGNPLKVYCDMTTDGGGWLLVANVVAKSPTLRQFSVKTTYRGISSKQMFLHTDAMKELRSLISFTQLRFHCNKQRGRTIHVITATNSKGEAAVKYFSGQTDVQPASCGSFIRMKDDNSRLSTVCAQWGWEKGVYHVGKWGHGVKGDRLNNHPAFVKSSYHYYLMPGGSRWECDDYIAGVSTGDFWKAFVR